MKQVTFIEMMGVPGSYDASVYDHFEEGDQEGLWFVKRFAHVSGLSLKTCNVCLGDPLPEPERVDALVLAGTYNSVHDNTDWQQRVRLWLPRVRAHKIPILAVCGSHQLLAHMYGANVERLPNGPYAGTFPLELTDAGRSSPLLTGISEGACFQFANTEHVIGMPQGSILLGDSGAVPIAALDFGDHCYSTQFHPEGTFETLGAVWRYQDPGKLTHYHAENNGRRVVENFLELVVRL